MEQQEQELASKWDFGLLGSVTMVDYFPKFSREEISIILHCDPYLVKFLIPWFPS